MSSAHDGQSESKNVFGETLMSCCTDPMTGFFRDGFCNTGMTDYGTHIVCAQMTRAFLDYSKGQGNDLITPNPAHHFPGLKPGDCWCLCISRWVEAYNAGVAPPVNLSATHQNVLDYVPLETLRTFDLALQN